jgi:Fur family transcriptional regulator, ferric uptake regulator
VSRSNPGIPMSTVYRTLDLLRSFGLVSVMESSGRGKLYLHDAAEKLHLHCVNCGRTLSLDPEDMAELLAGMKTRFGFEIDIRRLSLTGRCSACH